MILHNILPIISLYKQRILMPIRLLLRFVKIVWPNTHFPIRAAYRHAYIWSIIPLFIYHRTYIYMYRIERGTEVRSMSVGIASDRGMVNCSVHSINYNLNVN